MSDAEPDELGRVRARYDDYARDPRKQRAWNPRNAGNAAIREELVDALAPWVPPHGHVVDAGCGSGWVLARLAQRGVPADRLRGVDVLPARVDAARRAVPGADVREGDVRSLPFGDGEAGLVLFLTVLSSLASRGDVERALASARRTLRPDGRIAVWEPRWPTPNRATLHVPARPLTRLLGPPVASTTTTLAPPIARAVPPRAYRALARVGPLRSHRLMVFAPGPSAS